VRGGRHRIERQPEDRSVGHREPGVDGHLGPGEQPLVEIVPPNPRTGASALLRVNGGAEYCVRFGGAASGQIANKGPTSFTVTNRRRRSAPPGIDLTLAG